MNEKELDLAALGILQQHGGYMTLAEVAEILGEPDATVEVLAKRFRPLEMFNRVSREPRSDPPRFKFLKF